MKKFLVLYRTPVEVIEEWMKLAPEERKGQEDTMKTEWNAWMQTHGEAVKETAGAGKTQKVTPEGVMDTKNDIMLFSLVEAESEEAAAKIFENHPHLKIPQSSIEVMPAHSLSGME